MQEKLTIDMTGKKIGKLTIIGKDDSWNGKGVHWLAKCECGNIKSYDGRYLRSWQPKSCGCEPQTDYSKEELIDLLKRYVEKNGYPTDKTKDFRAKNGLPDFTTYQKKFGGGLSDWLKICGYKLTEDEEYNLTHRGGQSSIFSKEECQKIVFEMQERLGRPLMYDDFEEENRNLKNKLNDLGQSAKKRGG